MRVLKRVLTRKSILGFGYFDVRDLSVQMLIDIGKQNLLINSYYGLEKIDFTDDILDELGITEKFRIIKPGKNPDLAKEFFESRLNNMEDLERIKYLHKKEKMATGNKNNSKLRSYKYKKDYLRAKNQGKL